MSRRTKLEFEPLSLEETAQQLGIPPHRAQGILTLVGVTTAMRRRQGRTTKARTRSRSPRSVRKSTR